MHQRRAEGVGEDPLGPLECRASPVILVPVHVLQDAGAAPPRGEYSQVCLGPVDTHGHTRVEEASTLESPGSIGSFAKRQRANGLVPS